MTQQAPPDGASRAILFDFDGTLAPNLDLPDMRRQVIDLTRGYAVPDVVFQDHYIVEIIDAAADWLMADAPDGADRYRREAHQLITDFELAAAHHTRPFPGMPQKLENLRRAGWRMGVVTRNCRAAVLAVFPEILELVDVVKARDDVEHLKPDPRHLQSCLSALACAAEHAVMVGDGHLDMKSGRELDMYCVGVLSGSGDAEGLTAAGAHLVIDHCLNLEL